jgi:hypothetical protein
MGKKLENVKRLVDETKEIGEKTAEMANTAVTDITSVRDIIKEVPQDVDDDILAATEQVSESATREATDFMNSEVKSSLDEGVRTGTEAADLADEQADLSHRAADTFGQTAGMRFGESASEARAQSETAAANFEGQAEDVRSTMEENQSVFDKALQDVMG